MRLLAFIKFPIVRTKTRTRCKELLWATWARLRLRLRLSLRLRCRFRVGGGVRVRPGHLEARRGDAPNGLTDFLQKR